LGGLLLLLKDCSNGRLFLRPVEWTVSTLIERAGRGGMCQTRAHAAQVLRGYLGDRSAKPVFEGSTPFNVLGAGYQRPFELATLRLSNMIGILPKCDPSLHAQLFHACHKLCCSLTCREFDNAFLPTSDH